LIQSALRRQIFTALAWWTWFDQAWGKPVKFLVICGQAV
jgi:hypothetical protein